MNYFSKKNITIIIIAVLLIINIATISTILYHSYGNRLVNRAQPERNTMRAFWNELNLSQRQIDEFGVAKKEFSLKTRKIMDEMSNIRLELINEMSSADPDTAKMFAMADEIGVKHAQIKNLTINHFLELKKNTTPEQFSQFVKLFQRMLMDEDHRGRSNVNNRGKRQENGRPQRNR